MENSNFKISKIKNKTTKLFLKLMIALQENKNYIKNIKTRVMILFLCFLICFTPMNIAFANELKIPAGTPITVYVNEEIGADEVQIDQNINFLVQDPVYINNKLAIKSGTLVVGQVIKLKNNSILGIPGEIQIGNFRINDSNKIINLRGTIIDRGTNRTWVNVGWFFWVALPLIFIKGNDGKISAGTYQILYTVGDHYINSNL